MIDETEVTRRVGTVVRYGGPTVDVRIDVEDADDERARALADEIAEAVRDVVVGGDT